MFYEMTLQEVQACIEEIVMFDINATSKEQYESKTRQLLEWIAPGGRQDISGIERNRLGTVIRPHGR